MSEQALKRKDKEIEKLLKGFKIFLFSSYETARDRFQKKTLDSQKENQKLKKKVKQLTTKVFNLERMAGSKTYGRGSIGRKATPKKSVVKKPKKTSIDELVRTRKRRHQTLDLAKIKKMSKGKITNQKNLLSNLQKMFGGPDKGDGTKRKKKGGPQRKRSGSFTMSVSPLKKQKGVSPFKIDTKNLLDGHVDKNPALGVIPRKVIVKKFRKFEKKYLGVFIGSLKGGNEEFKASAIKQEVFFKSFFTIEKEVMEFIRLMAKKICKAKSRCKGSRGSGRAPEKFVKTKKFRDFIELYFLLKKKLIVEKIVSKVFSDGESESEGADALGSLLNDYIEVFIQMFYKNYIFKANEKETVGKDYRKTFHAGFLMEGKTITAVVSPSIVNKTSKKMIKKPIVMSLRSSSSGGKKKNPRLAIKEDLKRKLEARIKRNIQKVIQIKANEGEGPTSEIEKEFVFLNEIFKNIPGNHYSIAKDTNNEAKNRDQECLPFDFNLLFTTGNSYNNASEMKIGDKNYIVTQYPYKGYIQDFWEIVYKKKVDVVVNLGPKTDKEHPRYWTTKINGFKKMKKLSCITLKIKENSEGMGSFDEIRIDVVENKLFATNPSYKGIKINLFHFKKFDKDVEQEITEDVENDLKILLQTIQKTRKKGGNILIHCENGANYSGLLLALLALMDRENKDIKETVFQIRKQRMGMIRNLNQYQFLYKFFGVKKE